MRRGVRFPSTARFCVTGWGAACKRSPLFFFFSFPLYFCWKQRGGLGSSFLFFFLKRGKIKVLAPSSWSFGAEEEPGGVSNLEKPFAGGTGSWWASVCLRQGEMDTRTPSR